MIEHHSFQELCYKMTLLQLLPCFVLSTCLPTHTGSAITWQQPLSSSSETTRLREIKTVSRITRVKLDDGFGRRAITGNKLGGEGRTRTRSELTSPSLLHKNQTPSKKCSVHGFNTTSTTSPSPPSPPSLSARREETTWTEYRVKTATARRVYRRHAQPRVDFFAFLKVYFFFYFTRTPLWHVTSAKQHESTSTKRHHWDSGAGGVDKMEGRSKVMWRSTTLRDAASRWKTERRATCCWQNAGKQQIHLRLIQHKYLCVDY